MIKAYNWDYGRASYPLGQNLLQALERRMLLTFDVIIKDKCDNSILSFVCLCVICIGAFMRVSACFLSRNLFTPN